MSAKAGEERCPGTYTETIGHWSVQGARTRTFRCQLKPGHRDLCGYHRNGSQGGSWTRWWGVNKEAHEAEMRAIAERWERINTRLTAAGIGHANMPGDAPNLNAATWEYLLDKMEKVPDGS